MDIKVGDDFRTNRFNLYKITGENPYNYAEEGILTKCLPKILFKGNSVLVAFLQLLDMRLILLFKYIDKIKRFKYISWY